jgi:hypothetical protein
VETDYLLLTPSETKQYAQALKAYKPIVIDTIGVSLYKNRKASKSIKGESASFRYAEGSLEYIGVGTYFADSTLHKNLKGFEVSMSSIFPKPNADLSWVISFFDEENKHLETRDFRLNHFSRNWKNGIPFNFYLSVPKIPQQTFEMRMYLYNPRLQPFEKIDVKYKTILCEE